VYTLIILNVHIRFERRRNFQRAFKLIPVGVYIRRVSVRCLFEKPQRRRRRFASNKFDRRLRAAGLQYIMLLAAT